MFFTFLSLDSIRVNYNKNSLMLKNLSVQYRNLHLPGSEMLSAILHIACKEGKTYT